MADVYDRIKVTESRAGAHKVLRYMRGRSVIAMGYIEHVAPSRWTWRYLGPPSCPLIEQEGTVATRRAATLCVTKCVRAALS